MKIYDITLPMEAELARWPGDVPYRRDINARLRDGDSVNLSAVTLSVHFGTHADAPFHFQDEGLTIETLVPEIYVGPCVVVDVSGNDGICRTQLQNVDFTRAPRLLLRTNAWTDYSRFPESVPTISPDVADFLGANGVVLLGLDVPSVDALDSKNLPNHHALGRNGIHILESLFLRDVPEGYYELAALPLKLVGADGAPVRAILREIAGSRAE